MAERSILVDGGSNNIRTLASSDTFALVTRTIFNRFANATTTTTAQETLWSNTIAANTFISDGGTLKFVYAGLTANNANEKEWQLQFNGTVLIGPNYISNIYDWRIEGYIVRASSSEVRCFTSFTCAKGTADAIAVDYVEISGLSLTSTNYNLVLKVTTADASGDITAKMAQAVYSPGV